MSEEQEPDFDALDYEGDDENPMMSTEGQTAFDDVALSLLLFFMVISMFANLQSSDQKDSGSIAEKLPVAGASLGLDDLEAKHRIYLIANEGKLFFEHFAVKNAKGAADKIKVEEFKLKELQKKLKAMVKEIIPEAGEGSEKLAVIVRLPREFPYKNFRKIWYGLTRLYRIDSEFKKRVNLITWGSMAGPGE